MDLLPTDEQVEITTSVRAMLADLHETGTAGTDALWNSAVEQGWFALGLPEDLGGVGYSLAEETLVFTEIGRAAAPGPFVATTAAARLLAESGSPDVAAKLIGGEDRACLAEPDGPDGQIRYVDHEGCGYALLTGPELSVVAVPDDLRDEPAFDTLVPLAVSATTPETIATCSATSDLGQRLSVLVAAQLVGIAQATSDQSVEYAKDREQFGQLIGGFQAVKHRCADMAVRAECADAQVKWAALAITNQQPDASAHAESAAIVATNAAVENAQWNIQNHGGIGFTWEHTAHRYLTMARMLAPTLGGLASHQAALLAAPPPL